MVLFVPGDGARALAARVAAAAGGTVGEVEFKAFPDGEEYARIRSPVEGQDVVVVETGFPPRRLWTLLLLLNAARENGARRVRCVVPYLPYARQDRVFAAGEALSARLVAEAIRSQAEACVTVELHKDEVARFFGAGGCTNLSAVEPFAAEFRRRGIDVVLAPDAGARRRAEAVAARIGAAVDHLEKRRVSGDEVEVRPKSLDVAGRRVAILDDIISTGGTMAKACEQLVRSGASTVLAAGVHGLFLGDAVARLSKAGANEVLASDTVESAHSGVGVADLIAGALVAAAPRAGLRR